MAGRPVVIAHRGASGYLPEHTLASKAVALAMGADFLEQDIVATRDGELLVFHDLHLDDLTDVGSTFPGRARSDGRHYCIDFTLEEIRRLRVMERRLPDGTPRFPGRFPPDAAAFTIPTLDEELCFISGLVRSFGRPVGIYPEIKEPAWHRQHGFDLGAALLGKLADHGYGTRPEAVFVQCFDPTELQRLRKDLACRLPLVLLLDSAGGRPSRAELSAIRGYADGVGPSMRLLAEFKAGSSPRLTGFAADASAEGLLVHPYTFRRDELPPGVADGRELHELLLVKAGVDGLFTDFPDLTVAFVSEQFPG